MLRVEKQVAVDLPIEKVFAYVADLERHTEWAGTPFEITREGEGPVAVGATFRSVGKQFGTHRDLVTIREYDPPRRVAFESKGDIGVLTHWFALSEEGGRTILRKGCEGTKPSLMGKLTMPLVKRSLPKSLNGDLGRIKAKIEGTA